MVMELAVDSHAPRSTSGHVSPIVRIARVGDNAPSAATRRWTRGKPQKMRGLRSVLGFTLFIPSALVAQPASLPVSWVQGGWTPGPEEFGVAVEPDVTVTMDDGAVIHTDVLYPALKDGRKAPGNFPVLVEQNPFRCTIFKDSPIFANQARNSTIVDHARYFTSRGYIYVLAQSRGTCHSGGNFEFLSKREGQDGVKLVDWAAHRLPGSDGRLGLIGCSYPGGIVYRTAALLGEGSPVKAMAPTGISGDLYSQLFFPGGALSSSGDLPFTLIQGSGMGQTSGVHYSLNLLADMRTGGPSSFNGEYWQQREYNLLASDVVRTKIPTFIYSGWDDLYPNSYFTAAALQNAYLNRDTTGPLPDGAQVSPKYQIMMATGPHCSGGNGGPRDEATLAWFDTWIKGKATGIASVRAPFHLHVANAEEWRSYSRVPFVERYSRFYLADAGSMRPSPPQGETGSDGISYAAAADGATLSYETPAFEQGAMLVGSPILDLFASSSNNDMLLISDLYDVAGDGSVTRLTTGSLIASMRGIDKPKSWLDANHSLIWPAHDFTRATPLAKDQTVEMPITLRSRMVKIAPGHRLRLIIRTQTEPADCQRSALTVFPCIIGTVQQQLALADGRYKVERNHRFASSLTLPLEIGAGGGADR
jgi:hypothetical protein